jgi:hypothetical protein
MWSLGVSCCLILAGCQQKLKLGIVNHIGSSVMITVAGKNVTLANNEVGRFDFPAAEAGQTITVAADNCVYQYQAPVRLDEYRKLDNPEGVLMVQLERGAQFFALPPTATGKQSVLDEKIQALQKEEFPIGPVKKSCTPVRKK